MRAVTPRNFDQNSIQAINEDYFDKFTLTIAPFNETNLFNLSECGEPDQMSPTVVEADEDASMNCDTSVDNGTL